MEKKNDQNIHHDLLKLGEFCDPLKIKLATGRSWILKRRIAVVKIGRLVRIPKSELERIVKEGFRPAKIDRGQEQ